MRYSSSFTHDLKIGEDGEDWAKSLFGNSNIEVKTDLIAHRTGNMFIEIYSRGVASGISNTTAEYWVYIIQQTNTAIIVSTTRLKELVKKYHAKNGLTKGGDDDTSLGVLIPLVEILTQS